MHDFLAIQIARDTRELVIATSGLAAILLLLVLFLFRTNRTGWVMASFLMGTLIGLPVDVYQFNRHTQFAMPHLPLIGWLFEIFGMWFLTWVPYGALGLGLGWIILKRRSKTESSADTTEAEPASTAARNRQEALRYVSMILGHI